MVGDRGLARARCGQVVTRCIPARFSGGSLDGQILLSGVRAAYYIVQVTDPQIRTAATIFVRPKRRQERYRRTRVVYVDGSRYANDCNQASVSHFEYELEHE